MLKNKLLKYDFCLCSKSQVGDENTENDSNNETIHLSVMCLCRNNYYGGAGPVFKNVLLS